MAEPLKIKTTTWLFCGVGIAAVIAGGVLAAFSARNPSEYALWASAYLVLIVGVLQIAFGFGTQFLSQKAAKKTILLAFTLYNLGNLDVLLGTAVKNSDSSSVSIVNMGGGALAISMILLIWSVRGTKKSWILVAFYFVTAVIFVSMPIGLILARQ